MFPCVSIHYTLIRGIASTHVADTPSDSALFAGSGGLVGLAVDAQVHDVVAADGTVVDDNVPSPESDSVPLACYVSCGPRDNAT